MVLLLGVGLLGALLAVAASERGAPFPPRPIRPDDEPVAPAPTSRPPAAPRAPVASPGARKAPSRPLAPAPSQTVVGSGVIQAGGIGAGDAIHTAAAQGVAPPKLPVDLPPAPTFPPAAPPVKGEAPPAVTPPDLMPAPAPEPKPAPQPPAPVKPLTNDPAALPAIPDLTTPPGNAPAAAPPLPGLPEVKAPPPGPIKDETPPRQAPPPVVAIPADVEPLPSPRTPAPVAPTAPPAAVPAQPEAHGPKQFELVGSDRGAPQPPPQRVRPEPMPEPIHRVNRQIEPPPGPYPQGKAAAPPTRPGERPSLYHVQTPLVALEKYGPAILKTGEVAVYEIVVRNLGPGSAQRVRVTEELPAGAKVVAADPQGLMDDRQVTWEVTVPPPGSERVLKLALQPTAAGPAPRGTHLSVIAGPGADANVQQVSAAPAPTVPPVPPAATAPPAPKRSTLDVHIRGPETVVVGRQVVFEVTYVNQGHGPVAGLVLFGYLPQGLKHPMGHNIEAAVGSLPPGASKTIKLTVTAARAGRYPVAVKVTAPRQEPATAETAITVTEGGLKVQPAPVSQLPLGRAGEVHVQVSNDTAAPLKNVVVTHALEDGLEFLGASDRGLFHADGRSVHWLLEALGPGESHTLTLRLRPTKPGSIETAVAARADGLDEVRVERALEVRGHAELAVRVIDRDNPLEVGRETVYEIQVANRGTSPASAVKLEVAFSDGLQPKSANGPARYRLDRHGVTFEPLPVLPPRGQVVYRVAALGVGVAGQRNSYERLRVTLTSDQLDAPVLREHDTLVYRD